jgi:hypothetical protein
MRKEIPGSDRKANGSGEESSLVLEGGDRGQPSGEPIKHDPPWQCCEQMCAGRMRRVLRRARTAFVPGTPQSELEV